MQLSIGIAKFLLVSVLCVASWSRVEAENKVTLTSFDVDIPSNDVVESWKYDHTDNLVDSTINIKKNCPKEIKAEIRMFQDGKKTNTIDKMFSAPMEDIKSYNICGSIDSPDRDDDSCSIADGEQFLKECDVGSLFSSMQPGNYKVECDFQQNDNIISTINIEVTVEGE